MAVRWGLNDGAATWRMRLNSNDSPFMSVRHESNRQTDGRISALLNPLMHKVAKMVTQNNGVRRHAGLTHCF